MSDFTIIELSTTDSTNNYAMQLIDANKAHHGLAIVAETQTGGKGQRGRKWVDRPGASLLISIIIEPRHPLNEQFAFNAAIAMAIANVLQKSYDNWDIHIKWPNDIIINDKKAGGILIENVLRGSKWTYSVVGIGLNIHQDAFPADLPYATSLKAASGKDFDITTLRDQIIERIMSQISHPVAAAKSMEMFNELLYKRGRTQKFSDQFGVWEATIVAAMPDGGLQVQHDNGTLASYQHGQINWEWA